MRRWLPLTLIGWFAMGCASVPKGHRQVTIGFGHDPLDHKAEEAIEQVEIVAPRATVQRVRRLPTDWTAGGSRQPDGSVRCVLSCDHLHFALDDIHSLDGVVGLVAPAVPEIRVTIWITRGPLGEGRVIALSERDLCLK